MARFHQNTTRRVITRWTRERGKNGRKEGLLAAIISTGGAFFNRREGRGRRECTFLERQQRRRGFNYNAIFARPFETLLRLLRSNARSNHASVVAVPRRRNAPRRFDPPRLKGSRPFLSLLVSFPSKSQVWANKTRDYAPLSSSFSVNRPTRFRTIRFFKNLSTVRQTGNDSISISDYFLIKRWFGKLRHCLHPPPISREDAARTPFAIQFWLINSRKRASHWVLGKRGRKNYNGLSVEGEADR